MGHNSLLYTEEEEGKACNMQHCILTLLKCEYTVNSLMFAGINVCGF